MRKNLFSKKNHKEQKRFLFYGIINFLITNSILQITLLLFETYVATLISQCSNLIIGFFLYGQKVFKFKNYSKRTGIKYFFLAVCIWLFNWSGIEFITTFKVNKNIAAMLLIPILVIISYICQKNFVFKEKKKQI